MLATQLELFPAQRLMHEYEPPKGAIVPATYMIGIPYEWESVEYLLTLPSVDFGDTGLSSAANRERKMADWGYGELRDDIAENGFINPVYIHPIDDFYETETQGNGHHRVCVAVELGYTHIPVTRDWEYEWDSDGVSTG